MTRGFVKNQRRFLRRFVIRLFFVTSCYGGRRERKLEREMTKSFANRGRRFKYGLGWQRVGGAQVKKACSPYDWVVI